MSELTSSLEDPIVQHQILHKFDITYNIKNLQARLGTAILTYRDLEDNPVYHYDGTNIIYITEEFETKRVNIVQVWDLFSSLLKLRCQERIIFRASKKDSVELLDILEQIALSDSKVDFTIFKKILSQIDDQT